MHLSNYPHPPGLIVTVERVTNSSLIEVSESLILYDFIVTCLGGNDSNGI